MKQRSPFCAGIWPFLVFPVLLLIPLLLIQFHSIEEKIAEQAQDSLSDEFSWARIESFNRGRDPLIVGIAPDPEQVEQAVKTAGRANGVRTATFAGSLGDPKAPIFSFTRNGDRIKLSGSLANQTAVESLTAHVEKLYPKAQIDNQLSVGSNVADDPRLLELVSISAEAPIKFSLSVQDATLNYQTVVQSANAKNQLAYRFNSVFDRVAMPDVEIVAPRCQIAVNKILSSAKINFSVGNADINRNSDQTLQSLAEEISGCPDAEFEIEGHTDSSGTPESNLELSRRRAEAVLDRLVGLGLDRQKFAVVGFGATKPIADNESTVGRAQNRRIQFRVTN